MSADLQMAEGDWLASAAMLPAGDYAWHRFPRRGYVALAGVTPVATVAPVAGGGWSLRLEGFRWRGSPAGTRRDAAVPADCRWFATSRGAVAAAGKLLSAAPFSRREQVAGRARPGPAPTGQGQTVLAL